MATNKTDKVLNVPTLRFPGFTDEWEKMSIGSIASKVGSGSTPRGGSAIYEEKGRPFVRSQNIGNGFLLLDDIVHISEEIHNQQKNTEIIEQDVMLNITGASIGRCAIADTRIAGGNVNQHVCIIRSTSLNPIFLSNYILSHRGQKQIESFQAGGNREGLNFEQVRSIRLNVPQRKEQDKISSLLTLLDERIALQSKLIDRLKSLMDGIIDKVTALTPNISIGECLDCYSSTLQECETEEQGTYPVYGANGVCGYLDYATISAPAILIVKDGSGVGNVSYANGDCSVVGTLNYLQPKRDVSAKFLYFVLKRFNFQPYKTGMAIPHIYFKAYSKTRIFCPDYEEQTRMAASLSRIEDKIALEERLLCLLQEQKHYLLSAMFI